LAFCQAYNFGSGKEFKHQVAELLTDINRAVKESQERKIRENREALQTVALRPFQYPLWVLFICGFIILSAYVSLNSAAVQVRALSNLWRAEVSARNGDSSSAISAFRNVLADVPTSRDSKIGLAKLLFVNKSQSDSEEALNLLNGIELTSDEWSDLKKVIPLQYQQLFEEKKK
jgi:predicted Zn-dependent protease